MSTVPTPMDESVFFEFPARAYLEKYYDHVGDENAAILRFILRYLERSDACTDRVIEVAGGPSLFSLMAIGALRGAPIKHVTFTDIGWKNLREVESWLREEPHAFDYSPLLDWLDTEIGADPAAVADSVRRSRWELVPCDWRNPARGSWRRSYDVVSAHFFAESATSDEAELLRMLANVGSLGRPGGTVLLSFMCRSSGYVVGQREFPAFAIDEDNVERYLAKAGIELVDVELGTAATEDPSSQPGYDGMVFVGGRLTGRR